MNIKLIVENGRLHTSHADIADPVMARYLSGNPVLSYGDGEDCDTIAWPLVDKRGLACALYESREMGLIPNVQCVTLPNGENFYFTFYL